MAEAPNSQVNMLDFVGMVSDVDKSDLPAGAGTVQVNLTCIVLGSMTVRLGYMRLAFENYTSIIPGSPLVGGPGDEGPPPGEVIDASFSTSLVEHDTWNAVIPPPA